MIPSAKTLMNLGIDQENAKKLRKILENANTHDKVDAALKSANDFMGGHGVEPLTADTQVDRYYYNIVALYVNMGDTYNTTLLYDTDRETFNVCSWG